MKISFSAVQTIGILNVGEGVYDYYRPLYDREVFKVIDQKGIDKESLSQSFIKVLADEERAKRMQLLWGSSLLATQYLINAYVDDAPDSLKDIYQFMAGINLIVVGYTYFFKEKYEQFYYDDYLQVTPVAFKFNDNNAAAGLRLSARF